MSKNRSRSRSVRRPRTAVVGSLTELPITDLQREILRRQRGTKSPHRRRAKLLSKIAAIDAQILAAGGSRDGGMGRGASRAGTGRTRPKNDSNLIDALRAALKSKTMGVAEAMDAVLKSGYRTSAANFKVMVNANLGKKKFFKRVERGR